MTTLNISKKEEASLLSSNLSELLFGEWTVSDLIKIMSSLIWVYTVCSGTWSVSILLGHSETLKYLPARDCHTSSFYSGTEIYIDNINSTKSLHS